ncbi:MAG: efflux RND transporter periplasmic adaptor subunit [Oscillospiraceae bacterium]|nr:efflux RND transporter periplasmic adaptor subunit [Oscillospiraceae bacterium]
MENSIENFKNKAKKPKLKTIIILAVIAAIVCGLFFLFSPGDSQPVNAEMFEMFQFTPLVKTDLNETLSLSGTVYSSDTKNIYSPLNYAVEHVFVQVGDEVRKGDVLVQLDTTSVLYEIETAENNLESARESLNNELLNNKNAVTNAENSLKSAVLSKEKAEIQLEKSLDDLKLAENDARKPFDSYQYDNAISENKTNLDRRAADLEEAKKDYDEVQNDFDDYTHRNNIAEAKSTIEKKQLDLEKAEEKLRESIEEFDEHTYRIAINNATVALNRARVQQNSLDMTSEVQSDWVSNSRAVEDAERQLKDAQENLRLAREESTKKAREVVDDAKIALADSQRAYERAVTDLEKAREDAAKRTDDEVKTAQRARESAQRAHEDAVKNYDKSLNERRRAQRDAADENAKKLETAKRNVDEAEKSLESAELSVITAQESLEQARTKEVTTTVRNQEIALKKLYESLEKCTVKSTADGTVTSIKASEGNTVSGELMTIVNDGMLYVSANVMEFNIGSVKIGQETEITTVATKDKVFFGEIVYISPAAGNKEGTTGVEYEVWAEFSVPPEDVRIGMNAFVEIIISKTPDVYALNLSSLIERGPDTFILCNIDGVATEIPVTVGVRTALQAEISGEQLKDGMLVINNPLSFEPGDILPGGMPGGSPEEGARMTFDGGTNRQVRVGGEGGGRGGAQGGVQVRRVG